MTAEQMRGIVVGAVARGWCHRDNEQKVMDPDLAMAIVDEVIRALPLPPEPPIIAELEAALRKIVFDWDGEPEDMHGARAALASLATYRGKA